MSGGRCWRRVARILIEVREDVAPLDRAPDLLAISIEAAVPGDQSVFEHGDLAGGISGAAEVALAPLAPGAALEGPRAGVVGEEDGAAVLEDELRGGDRGERLGRGERAGEPQGRLGEEVDIAAERVISGLREPVDALAVGLVEGLGGGLLDVEPRAVGAVGPDRDDVEADIAELGVRGGLLLARETAGEAAAEERGVGGGGVAGGQERGAENCERGASDATDENGGRAHARLFSRRGGSDAGGSAGGRARVRRRVSARGRTRSRRRRRPGWQGRAGRRR